jgi:class 3 adenylate cyclase
MPDADLNQAAPKPADAAGAAPPRRRRVSLALLLSLVLAAVTGASLLVTNGIGLWSARQNLEELLRDRAALLVDGIDSRLKLHLDPVERQLDDVAAWIVADPTRLDRPADLAAYFRGAMASTPQVPALAFTRPDYATDYVLRADGRYQRLDWSDRAEIVAVIADADVNRGPTWSDPILSPVLGRTLVVHRRPVHAGGRLLGVLFSSVTIDDLSRHLDAMARDLGVSLYVLYGRDRVLAHPAMARGGWRPTTAEPIPLLSDAFGRELASMWRLAPGALTAMAATDKYVGHFVTLDGDYVVYIYREVKRYGPTPWLVGFMWVGGEGAQQFNRFWWTVGAIGGVLVLALAVAAWTGRRLARPIVGLTAAAAKVRDRDLAAVPELPPSRIRELDAAAGTFNAMVTGLRWSETYLPRALVHRLLERGDAGVATLTREQELTVMFTDIVGFSTLSETLSAAEVATLLNEHFALIGRCVETTGGTIDKFTGDGVMAFWGAPDDQPDHARRAYRAVKQIAHHIGATNLARREAGKPPLSVRIGLHTGRVVVGNIGFDGRMNYTVVGDTVNVCQRLEQLGREVAAVAPPREVTVVASDATVRAIGPGVAARPLGLRHVKGRAGDVLAHEIA